MLEQADFFNRLVSPLLQLLNRQLHFLGILRHLVDLALQVTRLVLFFRQSCIKSTFGDAQSGVVVRQLDQLIFQLAKLSIFLVTLRCVTIFDRWVCRFQLSGVSLPNLVIRRA